MDVVWVYVSLSVFIHSVYLSRSLSFVSLSDSWSVSLCQAWISGGAFPFSPTPLYTPPPPPSNPHPACWWSSAACFHGNITFDCLQWALTFQFWLGWRMKSCGFFRWKEFLPSVFVMLLVVCSSLASNHIQNLLILFQKNAFMINVTLKLFVNENPENIL